MIQRFAVPVGAGAVSALLFALTIKGTPLALALAYLAPLPLMIAAFGWGALGGLVAAVIAGSALVAVFDLQGALAFLLVVAVARLDPADRRHFAALRAAMAARATPMSLPARRLA